MAHAARMILGPSVQPAVLAAARDALHDAINNAHKVLKPVSAKAVFTRGGLAIASRVWASSGVKDDVLAPLHACAKAECACAGVWYTGFGSTDRALVMQVRATFPYGRDVEAERVFRECEPRGVRFVKVGGAGGGDAGAAAAQVVPVREVRLLTPEDGSSMWEVRVYPPASLAGDDLVVLEAMLGDVCVRSAAFELRSKPSDWVAVSGFDAGADVTPWLLAAATAGGKALGVAAVKKVVLSWRHAGEGGGAGAGCGALRPVALDRGTSAGGGDSPTVADGSSLVAFVRMTSRAAAKAVVEGFARVRAAAVQRLGVCTCRAAGGGGAGVDESLGGVVQAGLRRLHLHSPDAPFIFPPADEVAGLAAPAGTGTEAVPLLQIVHMPALTGALRADPALATIPMRKPVPAIATPWTPCASYAIAPPAAVVGAGAGAGAGCCGVEAVVVAPVVPAPAPAPAAAASPVLAAAAAAPAPSTKKRRSAAPELVPAPAVALPVVLPSMPAFLSLGIGLCDEVEEDAMLAGRGRKRARADSLASLSDVGAGFGMLEGVGAGAGCGGASFEPLDLDLDLLDLPLADLLPTDSLLAMTATPPAGAH